MNTKTLWSGRLREPVNEQVARFNASIDFDRLLYKEDIAASRAHAVMLADCGILTAEEGKKITAALKEIQQEIEHGKMQWQYELEDIHTHVENRLVAKIGDVGKKLHTARSRNDQVATDLRLWLRKQCDDIIQKMDVLSHTLATVADREHDAVMPGFTHLQVAQPVTFGHHMLAWNAMLLRDSERLQQCRRRINQLPLGSAALAGTGYPINRQQVADALGFEGICENSLDAVSDRDFALEFCMCAATCMMHLSRWSEELVFWNSSLIGFVALPDAVCTGSSIMPQKKNPDVPELLRGKSARVFASVTHFLTLMKAQPLAYNKDNQEDKEPLFDAVATLRDSLQMMTVIIDNIQVKRKNMLRAFDGGYATATDVADYLTAKGVAFRDAYRQVGELVAHAIEQHKELDALTIQEIQRFCPEADDTVFQVLTLERAVQARNSTGGTAPQLVQAQAQRQQKATQKATR